MYNLIRTQEAFDAIKLDSAKVLFCDTETCEELGKTKPKGGFYGRIRLFQIYQKGWKEAILIDCFFLQLSEVLARVKPYTHIYHNASYDLHTINCHTDSLYLPKDVHDTFYLAKSVYTQRDKFDFYSCLRWAGLEDNQIRSIDKKANQKADWSGVLTPKMLVYAAIDVLYLSLLYEKVEGGADKPYKFDIANLKYAIQYDRNGLTMNQTTLAEIRREHILLLEGYSNLIPCNINSPKQCCDWLGVASTKANILADLALNGNKNADNLRLARKSYKILDFVEKYDRPIMKSFHNSCGARTSRMTATGGDRYGYDNLQNPPRALYKAMEAPPGYKYVYADYSGVELRMVAAYIGEPKLEQLYKQGVDVHAKTGASIFNCSESDLVSQQRWAAKAVSFSTIYGAGKLTVQGIMQTQGNINKSLDEIGQLQSKWLELYPSVEEWHKLHARALRVYGYIDTESLLGRVMRAVTYTESFNFPIQSSSAEALKVALWNLHQYPEVPYIANVVHDSITLLCKEGEEAELWGKRLTESMQAGWHYVIKFSAVPDMPMVVDTIISTLLGVRDKMEIELINGSMIKLVGSDQYDSLMGLN